MPWKPEYAANRRSKAEADPEYRAKRNEQAVSDPETRKAYMAAYAKANPQKYRRTPEQRAAYNAKRRVKYAENESFREAHKATVRQWAETNPHKKQAQRISKYGLTPEQLAQMLAGDGAWLLIDEAIRGMYRKLADDMFETMYAAPGVGLAATQVGEIGRAHV